MAFNKQGTSTPTFSPDQLGVSGNGNLQVKKSAEQVLFECCASFLYGKDTYYNKSDDVLARFDIALEKVVRDQNWEYLKNLAKFARHEMGMRSMPIYLGVKTAELARKHKLQNPFQREMVFNTIGRADALTEIVALSLSTFGNNKNKLPMAIKRAVADGFNLFDEYQFGKYRAEGKQVWLRDSLRIVRPTPKDEKQSELFKKIATNTLETPKTWEVLISENGQKGKDKKDPLVIWKELVMERKLGYLAMLRNIRNMVEAGMEKDKEMFKAVCDSLANPNFVRKGKVFPYQIYTSIKVVNSLSMMANSRTKLIEALDSAMEAAVDNIPSLGDNVWLILDVSGSMTSPIMPSGKTRYGSGVDRKLYPSALEIAAVFTAACLKKTERGGNAAVTIFSDNAATLSLNRKDSMLTIVEKIFKSSYGGGTNIWAAQALRPKLGFTPDTCILFSDMQVNTLTGHSYYSYGSKGNKPNVLDKLARNMIAFNLNQSETTPASEEQGWLQLTGYSDKVFKFLEYRDEKKAVSVVEILKRHYAKPEGEVVEVSEEE